MVIEKLILSQKCLSGLNKHNNKLHETKLLALRFTFELFALNGGFLAFTSR